MLTKLFILLGKRNYGCDPKKRGSETRGKKEKGNGQTGKTKIVFILLTLCFVTVLICDCIAVVILRNSLSPWSRQTLLIVFWVRAHQAQLLVLQTCQKSGKELLIADGQPQTHATGMQYKWIKNLHNVIVIMTVILFLDATPLMKTTIAHKSFFTLAAAHLENLLSIKANTWVSRPRLVKSCMFTVCQCKFYLYV